MIVGSVLIQPQKIARSRGQAPRIALMQDVMILIPRMIVDGGFQGPSMGTMRTALEAAVARIAARVMQGLDRVRGRVEGFIGPIESLMDRVGSALDGSQGPAEAARAIEAALKDLADRIEGLGADNLRIISDQITLMIQSDLGLTSQFIEEQLWTFVDEALVALEASPAEERDRDRQNRLMLVSVLRRLKAELRGAIEIPPFSAEAIAAELVSLLRDAGAKVAAQRASCLSRQAGKAVGAAATIFEAVPLELGSSIGAASPTPNGHTYSWYASWLLGDDIWIDKDKRTLKRGYRTVAQKDGVTLMDLPEFTAQGNAEGVRYTFARHDIERLEGHARVWSWLTDGFAGGLHLLDVTLLTQSRILSNVLNIVANTGTSLFTGLYKAPMRWWLFDSLGWNQPSTCCACCSCCNTCFDSCLRFLTWGIASPVTLATFIGSFEQYHSNSISYYNEFAFWITTILPDVYRTYGNYGKVNAVRDIWLSWMTLRNHIHDPLKPAANIKHHQGLWQPVSTLAVLLFVKLLPRKFYYRPAEDEEHTFLFFVFMLVVAPILAILGLIAGWYPWQAALCGGKVDDKEIVGEIGKLWLLTGLLVYPSMFIMEKAGSTGGGTYNPAGGADYPGYPEQDTSPYNLPYGSQRGRVYVGQANMGFFSHQAPPLTGRDHVYAYDFSTDHGDWILASRAGTVARADDTFEDENTDDPNTIVIQHDSIVEGHDFDPETGEDAMTFSRYVHGAQGSIREAFGVEDVNDVVGLRVTQGQRIMRTGDTGTSFHNHLHMDIRLNAAGNGPSVPFVFRDANNVIGDDGVCLPFREYKADTEDID